MITIASYDTKKEGKSESAYDPPLPNTTLEIKSTRGKHRTEKPVELISWILKYFLYVACYDLSSIGYI